MHAYCSDVEGGIIDSLSGRCEDELIALIIECNTLTIIQWSRILGRKVR